MLQSSLFPGLFFHLYSSAQVTRFPVRNRIVSSAERQKLSRTSTKTPSTSKIRIFGIGSSRVPLRKVGKQSSLSKPKVSLPSGSRSSERRESSVLVKTHGVARRYFICSTGVSAPIFVCRSLR